MWTSASSTMSSYAVAKTSNFIWCRDPLEEDTSDLDFFHLPHQSLKTTWKLLRMYSLGSTIGFYPTSIVIYGPSDLIMFQSFDVH
ncbi:hypothetical protein KM043_012932 [Ampulex compressa]|nr:hypothetical protein KM043_012932 [Ampulex compressa]